jgi:hypothetical protein
MTIKLVISKREYIGLSGDTKPIAAPAGSTFHELDTGKKYIFDSQDWQEDISLIYSVSQGMGT